MLEQQTDKQDHSMKCPKCASADLRASRRKRWRDLLHAPFGRTAVRCRACGNRFYASGPGLPNGIRKHGRNHGVKRGTRRIRPWMWELALYTLLLLLFLFFLRYLTSEPAARPEGILLLLLQ